MIRSFRSVLRSAFAASVVAALLSVACAEDPTEVVVSVVSDVPCDASSVASVAVGAPGELGDRPASGTSTVCNPDGSRGDIVVVPKGSKGSEFAVEVRIASQAGANVDDCTVSNGYQNCIVARRILSFIPGRTVHMRVDLRNPCLNTPCSQLTTCIAQGTSKACLEAKVDVSRCDGVCDEGSIIAQHPDPVDPCSVNPCEASATCQATGGVPECVCAAGFRHPTGNVLACEDIDECAIGTSQCDVHSTCENSAGGARCKCNEGYVANADGISCTQVECTTQCAVDGACVKDSAGKFGCTCLPGYAGNGVTCTNIDECKTGKSGCDPLATCQDTPGGYQCGPCPAGYLDSNADGTSCVDVDECAAKTAPCAANAACANTPGAFTCTCPKGYADSKGDGSVCTEIDECALNTDDCSPNAKCTNNAGGFTCQCLAGYSDVKGNGTVCDDLCSASQVPVMTSNTAPSGTALSSGDLSASYAAWQAFDAANSMWISSTYQPSVWLEYDWSDAPRKILSYTITFTNGALSSRAPRDWTLAGWNGTAWVVVDTRSGELGWDVTTLRTYTVATPGSYSKYRMTVTQDNDDSAGAAIVAISIGRLQLTGCNAVLPP